MQQLYTIKITKVTIEICNNGKITHYNTTRTIPQGANDYDYPGAI